MDYFENDNKNEKDGLDDIYSITIICDEDTKSPELAYDGDSCIDMYAKIKDNKGIVIPAGRHSVINTGLVIADIPKNMEGIVRPKSGLAAQFGLTVLNSPGTIDCNYKGTIRVILINHGQVGVVITEQIPIAQLCFRFKPNIIYRIVRATYVEKRIFPKIDIDRDTRGLGSSYLQDNGYPTKLEEDKEPESEMDYQDQHYINNSESEDISLDNN